MICIFCNSEGLQGKAPKSIWTIPRSEPCLLLVKFREWHSAVYLSCQPWLCLFLTLVKKLMWKYLTWWCLMWIWLMKIVVGERLFILVLILLKEKNSMSDLSYLHLVIDFQQWRYWLAQMKCKSSGIKKSALFSLNVHQHPRILHAVWLIWSQWTSNDHWQDLRVDISECLHSAEKEDAEHLPVPRFADVDHGSNLKTLFSNDRTTKAEVERVAKIPFTQSAPGPLRSANRDRLNSVKSEHFIVCACMALKAQNESWVYENNLSTYFS